MGELDNTQRTIEDMMTPKLLACLIDILHRVMVSGYGDVTIRIVNGKPLFILETRSFFPEGKVQP